MEDVTEVCKLCVNARAFVQYTVQSSRVRKANEIRISLKIFIYLESSVNIHTSL